MFQKLIGLVLAFGLTPVRGEFNNDEFLMNIHRELMHESEHDMTDTRVWEHAKHFHEHHMEDFMYNHHKHMDEGEHDWKSDVECDGKCKCKKCVMAGGKYIMTMVAKGIKKTCGWSEEEEKENGYEHGKMKEWFCKVAKAQPEMVLGYMAYQVRPLQSSLMWCSGAQYCKKEHNAKQMLKDHEWHNEKEYHGNIIDHKDLYHEDILIDSEKKLLDDKEDEEHDHPHNMWHPHHPHHHEDGDYTHEHHKGMPLLMRFITSKHVEEKKAQQETQENLEENDESENSIVARKLESEDKVCKGMGCNCMKKCFMKTMKVVMEMSVKRTIMMCKKTKCHFLQKMCMFAKEHPKYAFGMLLAHVQPEKFAMGRCIHRHHHHHHEYEHHHMLHDISDSMPHVVTDVMHRFSDMVSNVFHMQQHEHEEKEGDDEASVTVIRTGFINV